MEENCKAFLNVVIESHSELRETLLFSDRWKHGVFMRLKKSVTTRRFRVKVIDPFYGWRENERLQFLAAFAINGVLKIYCRLYSEGMLCQENSTMGA